MKYESKRKSGQDKTIYQFSLGAGEIIVIRQLLISAQKKTPKTIDTMAFHGRIGNIIKEISKTLKEEDIKVPRSFEHQIE